MKLAIASDIHLEFGDLFIQNDQNADVLILSGDIAIAQDLHDHPEPEVPYPPAIIKTLGTRQFNAQVIRDFLKRCSFQFPHVIYIAGNHEFYHGKFHASLEDLSAECSKFTNVYFLEDQIKVIDDITFIGATLWTDMNKGDPLTLHTVADMMNDFKTIRNDNLGYTKLRPVHVMDRHRKSLEYIRTVIGEKSDQKFVVVAHHAPSILSIADRYRGDHLLNGAYFSDLSEFILDHPQIKLWTHGHVHTAFDYMIGDTRVVCNPRGYVGHERDYQDIEPYFPKIVEV